MSAEQPDLPDLAAELRLLAEALLDRMGPWLAGAAESDDAAPAGCGWCPVCALAAALRGERPELARRLAEQGAGVLAALRVTLDQHGDHPAADPTVHPAAQQPRPEGPWAAPVVQRIPVRRAGSAS